MDNWFQFLGTILVSVIAYLGGLATSKANATAVNVKTFQDLVNQVQALSKDLQKARDDASAEIDKVRDELSSLETKNRVLWQYVYAMIEHMGRNDVDPLPPPEELKSDPKLMKMIIEVGKKK
jgi:glutamine synthetase type III